MISDPILLKQEIDMKFDYDIEFIKYLEFDGDIILVLNENYETVFTNCSKYIKSKKYKKIWDSELSKKHSIEKIKFIDDIKGYFNNGIYLSDEQVIIIDECWLLYRCKQKEINNYKFLIIQFIDITFSYQSIRMVSKLYNEEKIISKIKSDTINMLSHEIRTPLSVVLLHSEYVLDNLTILQLDEKDSMNKIINKLDYVSELLNRYLHLNMLDAGEIKLFLKSNSIVDLLEDLIKKDYTPWIDKRKLNFIIVGEKKNYTIDKDVVIIIVNNILINAFKYSKSSKKTPILKIECYNDSFKIIVTDFGIGIPINEQKNIFNEYFRGENTSSISGNGLGFSIVNKLLKLHNAEMALNCMDNKTSVELNFKNN